MKGAHRFVDAGDARLHYLDVSPGADRSIPPVLLLPGGPGESGRMLLRELSRVDLDAMGLRRVAVDYRGIGRSTGAPGTFRLARLVDDLEIVREHLGVERVGLLGLSFGGFTALAYASTWPDRVAFLVVMDSAASTATADVAAGAYVTAHGTPAQQDAWRRWLEASRGQRPWDEAQSCADWGVLAPLYAAGRLGRMGLTLLGLPCRAVRRWPGLLRVVSPVERRIGYHRDIGVAWHLGEYASYDVREELHRIHAPTLVLCGERDWICPVSESRRIADAIPGAEMVVVPDAGHASTIDAPRAVTAALADFVDRRVAGEGGAGPAPGAPDRP